MLFETCVSEFHMRKEEFLFEYTLPQLYLLANARLERNRIMKERDEKSQPTGRVEDLGMLAGGF